VKLSRFLNVSNRFLLFQLPRLFTGLFLKITEIHPDHNFSVNLSIANRKKNGWKNRNFLDRKLRRRLFFIPLALHCCHLVNGRKHIAASRKCIRVRHRGKKRAKAVSDRHQNLIILRSPMAKRRASVCWKMWRTFGDILLTIIITCRRTDRQTDRQTHTHGQRSTRSAAAVVCGGSW